MKTSTYLAQVSLIALLSGTPAWAQSATPATPQSQPAAPAAEPDDPTQPTTPTTQTTPETGVAPAGAGNVASTQDIIVTGSRVVTNGNNSPTPITVVSAQQALNVNPGTLADALQILPVFSGSRGSGSNPSATGSVGAGNGSANQLNLRNLGTQETLVLMDGKRVPPTLISGIVDVDSIPQLMVSRVDIVTGGASAVYGSDAVAGVVNYIIDKKFQGVKVQAQSGISERGDSAQYQLGVAAGTDLFGGRGHIEASYQYIKQDGILRRSDRDFLQQAGVTGAGTVANPYVNQVGLRQSTFSAGGVPTLSDATLTRLGFASGSKLTFNPDGSLRPFVNGTATGTSSIQIGGDGAYYDSSLIAPLEFNQFFGRFDYDLTHGIHAYAQVSGNFKSNRSYADNLLLQRATVNSQNAFLLPAYRNALAAAGASTFALSEIAQSGPRLGTDASTDQINIMAGLDGKIGGYSWTVDYVHGASTLKSTQVNNVNAQNLSDALDAVAGPDGEVVCRSALTDPSTACSPLDVFGAGNASPEALAYVMQDTHYRATTLLDDVAASISGSPFATWAGPVNVALSGEWRKLSFRSESDATPNDYADCTGLRYNCAQGTTLLWQNTFPSTPRISNTVWEGAVEAAVPLVSGVKFIKSFTLNGAARYTSYQTSGDYWTWKVGADWHITDTLRLRATRSRDIRAPTLNDLFAPTYISIVSPTDLLTNTSPRVPAINESNPNLKAEIGNTFTAGAVWQPTRAFSLAVDYYHIKISNAITQLQGQTTQIQQLCYASGGTSPYCALQVRPNGFADASATNAVTAWIAQAINLAEIETEGVDVEANARAKLFDRDLALRFLAAYQPHIYYRQPGVPTSDQGGAAFGPLGVAAAPTVRLTGIIHYEPTSNFSIDVLERWRNAMKISGVPGEVWVNNHLDSFATTGVTLSFRPSGTPASEFFVNVSNLFDATPPTGGYTGNGTRAGYRDGYAVGDDVVGRAFTAGFRAKF